MSYLFILLNNSIFGKEQSIDHKCHESDCVGAQLHGLKLECCRCDNNYFFDCMASRPEIKTLLGLVNYTDKNNQKQIDKASKKFMEIFNCDSVFEFVCPSCKNDTQNSFKSQMGDYLNHIAQLKVDKATAKGLLSKAQKETNKTVT